MKLLSRLLLLLISGVLPVGTTFADSMPPQASSVSAYVDNMYWFITWLCVFFFVLIMALMFYFMWKYRRRHPDQPAEPSSDHNTPLELTWSLIPLALVIFIFYYGFKGYMQIMVIPTDAYEIQVTGQKWSWQFQYPNGYIDKDLHMPEGRKVRLVMSSQDVLHSMYIPAFRIKHDVIPGRFTKLWALSDKPGDYQIFCAEYCGDGHSDMMARAIVHRPGEFEKWLEDASNILDKMPPAEAGMTLYKARGCTQCHTVDGTPGIGPTFKGLFGTKVDLADGSKVEVDENYIRQSVLEPASQVVAGFAPVMPTFKGRLKDKEIGAIAAYLKTLK